jgi:coproporphyrinogen III oxidase-like Fe-S oxidoreductase
MVMSVHVDRKLQLSRELFELDPPSYHRLNFAQYPFQDQLKLVDLKTHWQEYLAKNPTVPIDFYVHIPFCHAKCTYCQYSSLGTVKKQSIAKYMALLIAYLDYFAPVFENHPFRHMYIGGGTPNSLSDNQMDYLLGHINTKYSFLDGDGRHQRNFELHPRIATRSQLEILKKHGINRISFGLESFNKKTLERYDRIYASPEVVAEIVKMSEDLGFAEMNVNLLVGLDGETPEDVYDSAEKLCRAGPTSIRLYTLQDNVTKSSWYTTDGSYYETVRETYERLVPIFRKYGYNGTIYQDRIEVGQSFVKGDPPFSSDYEVFNLSNSCIFAVGYQAFGVMPRVMRYRNPPILEGFDPEKVEVATTYVSEKEHIGLYLVRQLQDGHINMTAAEMEFGEGVAERFSDELRYLQDSQVLQKDNGHLSWGPKLSNEDKSVYSSIFLSESWLQSLISLKKKGETLHNRDWLDLDRFEDLNLLEKMPAMHDSYEITGYKTRGTLISFRYKMKPGEKDFVVSLERDAEAPAYKKLSDGYSLSYQGKSLDDTQIRLLEDIVVRWV